MKSRDIIRGRQTLHCQSYPLHEYYPEDASMNTIEELQAMEDEIDKTIDDKYAEIDIYLPTVTYDGGLVIDGNAINLYGSEEGRGWGNSNARPFAPKAECKLFCNCF